MGGTYGINLPKKSEYHLIEKNLSTFILGDNFF